MKAPYLEREEERELAVRWKDEQDQEALQVSVASHASLHGHRNYLSMQQRKGQ